jgi:thiamine-phosphate pyrophosphorylase
MKKIGRFHVLTDTVLQVRFSHVELARLAIAGGADTVQLRDKGDSTREMIRIAAEMATVCREAGVPFIVNDRIDVAIASRADGVHLGQSDFPIPLARRLLGEEVIIGGSAGTIEEARLCISQGADYVGFGPVYETGSKDDAGPVSGLALLAEVASSLGLPVIAIGGIGEENIRRVMRTGIHGIAVISAVCCRPDPLGAARSLRRMLEPDGNG